MIMALKLYKNGEFLEVGTVYKRIGNEAKPLSALYKCVDGKMKPIWEAGNLRTLNGLILQTKDGKIVNVKIIDIII